MVNVIAKVGSNGAKYLGKAVHADNTKILSKVAEVGSNGAKYLGKAVHADNTKILSKVAEAKGVLKEATARPLISKELQNFDFMLRKGLKINNIEIPADTFLAQVPKMQRKAIANLLGNPDKVVCTAKANTKGSGFSILGFIGKKGEKTVGKGAVSVSNIGSHDAVAKWRFNGKNLQTNGYVDCAQTATPEQVSIIPEFAKKNVWC